MKVETANAMAQSRCVEPPKPFDERLGALRKLPGIWINSNKGEPAGWNAIALPFFSGGRSSYRLLVNHYREALQFDVADPAVPNRGVLANQPGSENVTQLLAALDYQQLIQQVATEDFPQSGLAQDPDAFIHHEPGLLLHMKNETTEGINIARLGTIPHGDALLAMGRYDPGASELELEDGNPPEIGRVNGLPEGVFTTDPITPPVGPISASPPLSGYLTPYTHFFNTPFRGTVPASALSFPGFDPSHPEVLLNLARSSMSNVKNITTLTFTTSATEDAGIRNIPFIVKQANATSMVSTFWIMELDEEGVDGEPKLVMQYLQVVMLDFIPRFDGIPGLIGWPHISINTLEKVKNVDKHTPVLTAETFSDLYQ